MSATIVVSLCGVLSYQMLLAVGMRMMGGDLQTFKADDDVDDDFCFSHHHWTADRNYGLVNVSLCPHLAATTWLIPSELIISFKVEMQHLFRNQGLFSICALATTNAWCVWCVWWGVLCGAGYSPQSTWRARTQVMHSAYLYRYCTCTNWQMNLKLNITTPRAYDKCILWEQIINSITLAYPNILSECCEIELQVHLPVDTRWRWTNHWRRISESVSLITRLTLWHSLVCICAEFKSGWLLNKVLVLAVVLERRALISVSIVLELEFKR